MDPKRIDAARAGSPFYSSIACRVCAGAERYVSNGKCVRCTRARTAAKDAEEARVLREARAGVAT